MRKTFYLALCILVGTISGCTNKGEIIYESADAVTEEDLREEIAYPETSDMVKDRESTELTDDIPPSMKAPIIIVGNTALSSPYAHDNLLLERDGDSFKLIGRDTVDNSADFLEAALAADNYVGEAVKVEGEPQNDLEGDFSGSVYRADENLYILVTHDEDGSYLEYRRESEYAMPEERDFYNSLLDGYETGDIYLGTYFTDFSNEEFYAEYPDIPELYPCPPSGLS